MIYFVSPLVEDFLHDNLAVILKFYSSGRNVQAELNSFRGSLLVSFHLNFLSIDSFIFLFNFLFWLENKSDFTDSDDDMYSYFYDTILYYC